MDYETTTPERTEEDKRAASMRTRTRKLRRSAVSKLDKLEEEVEQIFRRVFSKLEEDSGRQKTVILAHKIKSDIYASVKEFRRSLGTSIEDHGDEERKIERENSPGAWNIASTELNLADSFANGLTVQGGSCTQYICQGLVVVFCVACATFIVLSLTNSWHYVCVLLSTESCKALVSLKEAEHRASQSHIGLATTPGELGYHGPFADAVLAAMPSEHVESGF